MVRIGTALGKELAVNHKNPYLIRNLRKHKISSGLGRLEWIRTDHMVDNDRIRCLLSLETVWCQGIDQILWESLLIRIQVQCAISIP